MASSDSSRRYGDRRGVLFATAGSIPMHYKLPRRPDTIVGLRMMILLNAPELGSKRGLKATAEPQAHCRFV
jgi:hypothetical protein